MTASERSQASLSAQVASRSTRLIHEALRCTVFGLGIDRRIHTAQEPSAYWGTPVASEAGETLLVDQLRVDGDSVVINGSVRDTARHENDPSGWRHSHRIYSTDYFISRLISGFSRRTTFNKELWTSIWPL
jgi:hypothetical protein